MTINPKLRILIADDHALVRDGIRFTLGRIYPKQHIRWIHEASSGKETILKVRKYEYDVVLLDITFPDISGIEIAGKIRKIRPVTKIIALTMHNGNYEISSMLSAGASGYLLKNTNPGEIKKAIDRVLSGKNYIVREVKNIMLTRKYRSLERSSQGNMDPRRKITTRQKQILQLVAQGNTNDDIGKILKLKKRTVDTHRFALLNRMGVRNTAELLIQAIKLGYLSKQ